MGVTLLACERKRKGEEREESNVAKWGYVLGILFWILRRDWWRGFRDSAGISLRLFYTALLIHTQINKF